jgi:hypothetical protein
MLLALKRLQVPVHRIGHSGSVHSEIEEHLIIGPIIDVMLRMKGTTATTSSAFNSVADSSSSSGDGGRGAGGCVIGCTCLSVQVKGLMLPPIKICNTLADQRNAEMAGMRFDYVLVDEAAQV